MSVFDEITDRKGTYCIKWDWPYDNPNVIPLTLADMDFKSPQPVIDAITKQAQHGIYGYAMRARRELSATVCAWLKQQNDWDVNPERIDFVHSVVELIAIYVCTFTKEGDAVIIQTPLYGHFKSAVRNAKRRLVCNELVCQNGQYVFDFDSFEQQIVSSGAKLYILCSPHNPTGRVWTREELEQVLAICARHDVTIIADEVHSDLIMPGHEFVPIAKLAEELGYGTVITMRSPAKTFNLAGLQLGYFVAPNPQVVKALAEARAERSYPETPNNFAVPATKAAYTECLDWLNDVRSYIQQNYLYLRDRLKKSHPQVSLAELQGTYLAWLDMSYLNVSEKELSDAMKAAGILMSTTSEFGLSEGLYARMNIACPRKMLEAGIDALESALTALS